jgi:hypothetical protein
MKKIFVLACYHLTLWGILGFFATLLFGFLTCCAGLPKEYFYISLLVFAITGITMTSICVARGCKK